MMKRYIISAVLIFFTAIGFAQKDVTAQYITNANFSSTSGWTENKNNVNTIGNGRIGTALQGLGNDIQPIVSTADATHTSDEYWFGFDSRWTGSFASYSQNVTLPAGDYTLSYDVENVNPNTWNASYDNRFSVKVGNNTTTDNSTEWMNGSSSWTSHTIPFSLNETSQATISLGYGTGNNNFSAANTPILYVSHLKLMFTSLFQKTLNQARSRVYTDNTGAIQAAISQWEEYDNYTKEFASEAEMYKAVAILNNAMTIAQNNGSATSLINNADFSGGIQTGATQGGNGRVQYPTGWTFGYTYDGWNDTFVDNGVFNAWAGSITWAELSQVISNLPNGQYRLTAEVKTDEGNDIKYRGASAVAIYGAPLGGNVGRSPEVTTSDFASYEVEFQVGQNQATIGIRSDQHYYQIRNIQLTYVPTNNATAQRDMLQQDYFWQRYDGDVDMTSEKYAEAKGAILYPQYVNQIIRVNSDDVIDNYGENGFANIVVNGYCEYLFVEDLQPMEIKNGSFDVFFAGYERTMNYVYGTVILPWPIYEEDVKVYEAHLYEMTGFTEGTDNEWNRDKMDFTHIEGSVPANTPILFRMMDGVPEEESFVITSYNVTVENTVSVPVATQAPGWTHQGYYSEQNFTSTDTYYIAHNHFWQVSTYVQVPPFRTVFRNSNSGANVYSISVDDELADAINRIEIKESTSGKKGIYNTSGQKVSNNTNTDGLAPGLYIINGKKVLVK
ncbi:MAG: hypothetical protein IKH26_01440 [Bacteroidaceae bacterium]|nr:hypothetical protein [Bacteroidaceae bacterium]